MFSCSHTVIFGNKRAVEMTGDALLHPLGPGRVQHEPDPLSHGLRGKVLGELCPDGAGVAVGAGHLAPDHAQVRLAALAGDRGLVLGLELDKDSCYYYNFESINNQTATLQSF